VQEKDSRSLRISEAKFMRHRELPVFVSTSLESSDRVSLEPDQLSSLFDRHEFVPVEFLNL
jgi:hypothetical protein